MSAPSVRPLSPAARVVLRVALVLAWLVGLGGGVMSCQRLALLHGPLPAHSAAEVDPPAASASVPAPASSEPSVTAAPAAPRPAMIVDKQAVAIEMLDRFRSTRLPLSVADMLLSGALVISAARTISRRRGARSWLMQFSIANAVLAIVDFVVSRPERDFLLDRVLHMPEVAADPNLPLLRQTMPAAFALAPTIECALFFGLAYALARPAVARELAPREEGGSPMPPSSADDGEA